MTFSGGMTAFDRVLAAVAAACVALLAWVWAPPCVPPELWEPIAVAAGIRPPSSVAPSLWQAVVAPIFRSISIDAGMSALRVVGPLSLAVAVYLVTALLMRLMPASLRLRMVEARTHRLAFCFAVVPAAVMFGCSDPIWSAFGMFSPDAMTILLMLGSATAFVDFIRRHGVVSLFLAAALLGPVAAESPFAFVAVLAYGGLAFVLGTHGVQIPEVNPLSEPKVLLSVQRWLTFSFLLFFILSVSVELWWFSANDGCAALGVDGLGCVAELLRDWAGQVVGAASPSGWFAILCIAVAPLVVSIGLLSKAVDEERLLPYWCAVVFAIIGMVAYFQLAGWPSFWFWCWGASAPAVRSRFLVEVGAFTCSLVLANALCVLAVELYFRRYERLFAQIGEARGIECEPVVANRKLRMAFFAVPVVLAAFPVAMCSRPATRGMMRALGDFIALCADDCAGAEAVVTDGSCDAGVELECARRGSPVKALPIVSASGTRAEYLRTRGEEDESDRSALAVGVAQALRGWVDLQSPRMDRTAVQIGFELWRRRRIPVPPLGATAARVPSADAAATAALAARGRELGARMAELASSGAMEETQDRLLRRMFSYAMWRIARTARMRSDAADEAGRTDDAISETELADALDDANPAYRAIRRDTSWIARQESGRMSPAELLRFSLDRGDFLMARMYARKVLRGNPDDPRGNFALGMAYLAEEQYQRAAEYLGRCVKRVPKEPAFLNNLALAELGLGRIDDAEAHAKAALELHPELQAVKRTLREIERAKTAPVRPGKNTFQ